MHLAHINLQIYLFLLYYGEIVEKMFEYFRHHKTVPEDSI